MTCTICGEPANLRYCREHEEAMKRLYDFAMATPPSERPVPCSLTLLGGRCLHPYCRERHAEDLANAFRPVVPLQRIRRGER